MKRLIAMTFLGVLLAALPSLDTVAGDDVTFAYAFEQGYEQAYKIKFNQETDMGFFAISMFADISVTEKCVAVEEGIFQMEIVFDEVDASVTMGGRMQDTGISEALTGQSVMFKLDANGEVDDIRAAGLIENFAQLRQQLIKPIIESGFPYLPGGGVSPGGKWSREKETDTTDQGLEITRWGDFEFKEMKEEKGRECALVKGAQNSSISGTMRVPQGAAEADGGGEGEFEFLFDPEAGIIVKLKGSMDINMDLVPEGGGDTIETVVGFTIEREIK